MEKLGSIVSRIAARLRPAHDEILERAVGAAPLNKKPRVGRGSCSAGETPQNLPMGKGGETEGRTTVSPGSRAGGNRQAAAAAPQDASGIKFEFAPCRRTGWAIANAPTLKPSRLSFG